MIPFVFQVLSQMLELHRDSVPTEYRSILPLLLQPASWAQKGSIPALVRLLSAFLARDGATLSSTGQFTNVLAVIQQRLIPSKVNDIWGFELLQAVLKFIPAETLRPYMKSIVTMLLTRLQTGRTDKYTYELVRFFMFVCALNVNSMTPDFLLVAVEDVQPQLWSQLLGNIFLPQISKIVPKDRKIVIVGLIKMLTESSITLSEPAIQHWYVEVMFL